MIIINHDNTVHGDYGLYGEVSCDVTGNTYSSVLTVQVVSAGVAVSACLKAGELLLGTLTGVDLDRRPGVEPSRHHNPVLKFYGTSKAENEYDNNINIYSCTIITMSVRY